MTFLDDLARTDRLLDDLGAQMCDTATGRDDLNAALAAWARQVDPARSATGTSGGRRLRRVVAGGALALATLMGSSVAAAVTDSDLGALADVGRVVVAWLPEAIQPSLGTDLHGGATAPSPVPLEGVVERPGRASDADGSSSRGSTAAGEGRDGAGTRRGQQEPSAAALPVSLAHGKDGPAADRGPTRAGQAPVEEHRPGQHRPEQHGLEQHRPGEHPPDVPSAEGPSTEGHGRAPAGPPTASPSTPVAPGADAPSPPAALAPPASATPVPRPVGDAGPKGSALGQAARAAGSEPRAQGATDEVSPGRSVPEEG